MREQDPIIVAAEASGELCTECGSIIDKATPGYPRVCADSETAYRWQDPLFACRSIKAKYPDEAPEALRSRMMRLYLKMASRLNSAAEEIDAGKAVDFAAVLEDTVAYIGYARHALAAAISPEAKP